MRYIDFAAAMGYEYALIDNWWDTNIGRERMKSLIDYARGKGVELFCGTVPPAIGMTLNKARLITWTMQSSANVK